MEVAKEMAYIYVLGDPRDGEVRYVGSADTPTLRYASHLADIKSGKTPVYEWMRELRSQWMKPVMVVLYEAENSLDEYRTIALLESKGCSLLNLVHRPV